MFVILIEQNGPAAAAHISLLFFMILIEMKSKSEHMSTFVVYDITHTQEMFLNEQQVHMYHVKCISNNKAKMLRTIKGKCSINML